MFNSGPVTTTGIEACLFYDPDGGERPTIQLYCAPIVYLDRDVSAAKPTWGVTLRRACSGPKHVVPSGFGLPILTMLPWSTAISSDILTTSG